MTTTSGDHADDQTPPPAEIGIDVAITTADLAGTPVLVVAFSPGNPAMTTQLVFAQTALESLIVGLGAGRDELVKMHAARDGNKLLVASPADVATISEHRRRR